MHALHQLVYVVSEVKVVSYSNLCVCMGGVYASRTFHYNYREAENE